MIARNEVTELLAAYKDQREDLEQLEKEDIPMRVSLLRLASFAGENRCKKCHDGSVWINHPEEF